MINQSELPDVEVEFAHHKSRMDETQAFDELSMGRTEAHNTFISQAQQRQMKMGRTGLYTETYQH